MQVSKAYLTNFANNLEKLSQSARNTLVEQLGNVDIGNRDEVAAVMRGVCKPYAEMSAALTAQFYDGIRGYSGVTSRYSAEAYSGYDAGEVTAASNAIVAEVEAGTATVSVATLLGDVADRIVNNSSNECVRYNARRDPARPKCAVVPQSANPCEWCVMRASAGFIYDQDSHSHNNCKCRLVPGYGKEPSVEGYNLDGYREQWDSADRAWRNGDIDEELAEEIQAAKERHIAAYNAGETSKRWDDTNAILMVMRRQ